MIDKPKILLLPKSVSSLDGIKSKVLNALDLAKSRLGFKDRIPAKARMAPLYPAVTSPQSRIDSLEARLKDVIDRKRRLEYELVRRDTDIWAVSELLHDSELTQERQQADLDWLVSLNLLFMRRPTWWFMLIPPIQRKLLHRRARRKKLFDAKRYIARYPDVVVSGQDPLFHYVRHGMWEGRVNDLRA